MRFITNLFKSQPVEADERKAGTSTSGSSFSWPSEFLAPSTVASGVLVNAETAMRVPAVSACVSLIASTIGSLPVEVFRLEGEAKELDTQLPAHKIVARDANPWTPAGRFRATLTADALKHGNGFAVLNRVRGRVVELIRINPEIVTIDVDDETAEPVYRVALGPKAFRNYRHDQIFHLAAPTVGRDGITGVSPIYLAREAIGLAITLEAHAARLFSNGARPSGILKHPGRLTPESAQRLGASWSTAHAGGSSGRTAILEEGMDFSALSFSSVDSQFHEMRLHQIVEIARAFNVPPSMIGDLSRATWSNSEQMGRQFLATTLLPWIRAWEAAYERALLLRNERGGFTIEINTDELLRADLAARAEAYSKLISARVLTPNEVRAVESYGPIDGGDTVANPFTSTGATPQPEPTSTEPTDGAD